MIPANWLTCTVKSKMGQLGFWLVYNLGSIVHGADGRYSGNSVRTANSSSFDVLFSALVLRRDSPSAAWSCVPARWTISNAIPHGLSRQRDILVVISVLVRILWSISVSERIVKWLPSKERRRSATASTGTRQSLCDVTSSCNVSIQCTIPIAHKAIASFSHFQKEYAPFFLVSSICIECVLALTSP